MISVLVTGPEASGTRLLARLLSTGAEVTHRSMPHGGDWWNYEDIYDHVVVILRDEHVTALSAVKAGHVSSYDQGRTHRELAEAKLLKDISRYKIPIVVRYEELIENPQDILDGLGEAIGTVFSLSEDIYNGNAPYMGL